MSIWHWQNIRGDFSAQRVWERLFRDAPISTVLENPKGFSIVAAHPQSYWQPPLGKVLETLKQLELSSPKDNSPDHLPFTGGYLGWLGYDLAWEIEALPFLKRDELPFPVAFWYEPRQFALIDHAQKELWLATTNPKELPELTATLHQGFKFALEAICPQVINFYPDRAQYCAMVNQAKQHIARGDIFQANLSLRFTTYYPPSGWQLYCQLHQVNPSPFAAYWRTPWGEMISCSPERLLKIQGDRVETRPIAGTYPKGNNLAAATQALRQSTKDIAEHIMLVDLERNDLGKVCQWGTVAVNELLTQEEYSHVIHLVSNVEGVLKPSVTWLEALRAVFPGGTITGCPKVRAMEIIETLEPQRRSLFYGSCGYLDRRGNLDLNILIRTLLKSHHQVWGQVGAGIVADSDPDREWAESLQKAKAQIEALGITT